MNPDKYQQAWKADAAQTRVTIDADVMSQEVQRSHRGFQSTIFWRDVREVGVSLLLLPIWFIMGFTMSLPWTWYLTVPALIWVTGFILVDRRLHPQRPSEPGEPLLYNVKESLRQVEHQIWLLRNVFWWYLLPFSISIMAFFLHVTWQITGVWWAFVILAGFPALFLLVIYGWIYRLNQSAVREQLEPRRQDLLKLVASLEAETTSEDSRDLFDLVSALADSDGNCGLNSSWAENWNRMIRRGAKRPRSLWPRWAERWAERIAGCGIGFPKWAPSSFNRWWRPLSLSKSLWFASGGGPGKGSSRYHLPSVDQRRWRRVLTRKAHQTNSGRVCRGHRRS